jgi:Ni/Co efflux regulator RcnB
MKLSRILLPVAAVTMIAAPTLASAAATTSIGKHHKAEKPVKVEKAKTVKAKKAK